MEARLIDCNSIPQKTRLVGTPGREGRREHRGRMRACLGVEVADVGGGVLVALRGVLAQQVGAYARRDARGHGERDARAGAAWRGVTCTRVRRSGSNDDNEREEEGRCSSSGDDDEQLQSERGLGFVLPTSFLKLGALTRACLLTPKSSSPPPRSQAVQLLSASPCSS